jgi:hypothetical protein
VGIFQLLYHRDIIESIIEVLVDRFEGAADPDVVLELDGGFVVDQGLEEAFCDQSGLELGWDEYKYLKKNILKRQGARERPLGYWGVVFMGAMEQWCRG